MLATILFAAATIPLGVWPPTTGGAAVTVHGVEFYVLDPEDDYSILAVQALPAPLRRAEPAELNRLVALADKLGADAVLLLGEMPEKAIPDDPDAPLPTTGRYVTAVFLSFDTDEGDESAPAVPSSAHRRDPRRHAGFAVHDLHSGARTARRAREATGLGSTSRHPR